MKSIMMVIPGLRGGGAERVASVITNGFCESGFDTKMVLTHSTPDEIMQNELSDKTELFFLQNPVKTLFAQKAWYKIIEIISRSLCASIEKAGLTLPAWLAYLSFIWQYYSEIKELRRIMLENPEEIVFAFLQPAIPITLLAARGLPNKVIVSERGDPKRLMKNRYGGKFLEKYYQRADRIVFQTEDARNTYPKSLQNKGVIIFNPIKNGLPKPYNGERKKVVSTFCRISAQKNLYMLIEAFAEFYKNHNDYELHIIGDTQNENDEALFGRLTKLVKELQIEDKVKWIPFSKNVHELIREDAMYVNSSDYEGMSNAMLEAMAIGLPTICTDCPIGGARAIIKNRENGFLVDVGSVSQLANVMCELAENEELANFVSKNAAKIIENQNTENILSQWIKLVSQEA